MPYLYLCTQYKQKAHPLEQGKQNRKEIHYPRNKTRYHRTQIAVGRSKQVQHFVIKLSTFQCKTSTFKSDKKQVRSLYLSALLFHFSLHNSLLENGSHEPIFINSTLPLRDIMLKFLRQI